jgi:hypothetical protein
LSTSDEVDLRVRLRIERQATLTGPNPPQVWAIIGEEVLLREVGDRRVMRAQTLHLIAIAELMNVTVQLMPFHKCGSATSAESFTIFRLAHLDIRTVVHLEQRTGATYLDATRDTEPYEVLMAAAGTAALSARDTQRFLSDFVRTL